MPKKTQEKYIEQLKELYGDKYDYSKVRYINADTDVILVCPIHGDFKKRASSVLCGFGCTKCSYERRAALKKGRKGKHRIVYGVGICDEITVDENGKRLKSYDHWMNMMLRCYSKAYQKKQSTYIGCEVCEEWKRFSGFRKWFDANYIEGYQLDKDLVAPEKRIYSPQTCEFVPTLINHITSRCKSTDKYRSKYGIGVMFQNNKFISVITEYGNGLYIGSYRTQKEAQKAYKIEKERYIKEVAQSYYCNGKITKRVYDALMKYEVEITD